MVTPPGGLPEPAPREIRDQELDSLRWRAESAETRVASLEAQIKVLQAAVVASPSGGPGLVDQMLSAQFSAQRPAHQREASERRWFEHFIPKFRND